MPVWGRRGTYPAVTATVTILAAVFGGAAILRPLIPPPAESALADRPGEFVRAGARQRVRWKTFADDPFGQAMREGKPVVLVMGTTGVSTAREFDQYTLAEPEVAERLNREYVSVRVDLDETPEWGNAYLPLFSAESGADPGWQVVVLSPRGLPVATMLQTQARTAFEPRRFLRFLARARKAVFAEDLGAASDTARRDVEERRTLLRPAPQAPDLGSYLERVRARATEEADLRGVDPMVRLYPWDWRFLAAVGDFATVRSVVGPILQSPMVDWLDGGFFRGLDGPGGQRPRYEGSAVQDADIAALLALLHVRVKDSFARDLAENAFDGVFRTYRRKDGFYARWWVDSYAIDRSPRHTFRPSQVREALTSREADWARDRLTLDPRRNPRMVPLVARPAEYVRQRAPYDAVLAKLRQSIGKDARNFAGLDSLATVGRVGARLIETARALDDPGRGREALSLLERARAFRVGPSDVVHAKRRQPRSIVSLVDYLAYADVAFEAYVTTGDEATLRDGLRVFLRGLELFAGDRPGVTLNGLEDLGVKGTDAVAIPCVVDSPDESTVGSLLRLACHYRVAFRDDPATFGELDATIRDTLLAVGEPLSGVSWRMGGVALGAFLAGSDRWIVTVGPDAVELAGEVGRAAPFVPLVPAVGRVRSDLQRRGAGVYLNVGGVLRGPLPLSEAQRLLGPLPSPQSP